MKTHSYEVSRIETNHGGGKLNIKNLRLKAGLTQVELAKKMRVDQAAVSRWESGETKPLRKSRKRLAKVLGCTVDELLNGE